MSAPLNLATPLLQLDGVKVDFPQPEGPISETNSPCSTRRVTSWSAIT